MVMGMARTMPQRMTAPTLAPKMPATPTGPGVGGTREWVMTRPPARATPRVTTDFLVFREMALANGDKITKPESQKMGMGDGGSR